jgi:hypothetical protein
VYANTESNVFAFTSIQALRLKQATKQQMNQTMIDNLRKMEMNKKKALMEKKKYELSCIILFLEYCL